MKFAWMKEHREEFPVQVMCRVLQASKSGYYQSLKRPVSARATRRQKLAEKIRRVHEEIDDSYGAPRIHRELVAEGEQVCRKTVARIMRDNEIRSVIARRFVPCTTDSNHDHPVAKNVLDRDFTATAPNQKWCCDITYVATDEGTLYLAAVMDLFSRKIVGWSMSDRMPVELVSDALTMALSHRRPGKGLLHHSDRGVQYACGVYQELLAEHGMVCSMSRVGNCYDNAAMESFWGTLKTECVYRHGSYATFAEARASIFKYIEVRYNRKRRHSSLGYVSPEAFEAALN